MRVRASDSTCISSFIATILSLTFECQDREVAWLWDAFLSVFVRENMCSWCPLMMGDGQVAHCISCLLILAMAASGLHKPKLNQSTHRGTIQWQHLSLLSLKLHCRNGHEVVSLWILAFCLHTIRQGSQAQTHLYKTKPGRNAGS